MWIKYLTYNFFFLQPSGLLHYLDSADEVPLTEKDRLHIRDNVKLAQVATHAIPFCPFYIFTP